MKCERAVSEVCARVAGMLLRWFMYLYNLEVCEEEAFLRWREDVTDAYPGKGEALFQVSAGPCTRARRPHSALSHRVLVVSRR